MQTTDIFERHINSILLTCWIACIIALLGFLAGFFVNVFGAASVTFMPFATIGGAGIAGLVAMRSVTTWRVQRMRTTEEMERRHKEEVYEALILQALEYFAGGSEMTEQDIRSKVSVWGGPQVIKAIAEWRRYINTLPESDGRRQIRDDQTRMKFYQKLFDVICAVRKELGDEAAMRGIEFSTMMAVLFDDFPAAEARTRISEDRVL